MQDKRQVELDRFDLKILDVLSGEGRISITDLAQRIEDMRAPPANRLEKLSGDRAGQWSVRISDQFRICFRWIEGGAEDVEIVDYH